MFCPQTDLCAKDLRPKSAIPHSVSNSGKAKEKNREGFSGWSKVKKTPQVEIQKIALVTHIITVGNCADLLTGRA